MAKMHTYTNNGWSVVSFNGYRGCALMSERKFDAKPGKTEVEYDVVQDLGEW